MGMFPTSIRDNSDRRMKGRAARLCSQQARLGEHGKMEVWHSAVGLSPHPASNQL